MTDLTTTHLEAAYIRQIIDMFDLVRKDGAVHECLVHHQLQTTLFALQRLGGPGSIRAFPEELAKPFMKAMLEALDFLHTEANVTHCGAGHTEQAQSSTS